MIYDGADKAVKDMNRRNMKAFGRLKLARFDELHVIREVSDVYDESVAYAERQYLQIARDAYIAAQVSAGVSRTEAMREARRRIDRDWILDMLEEYDPVTLYRFLPEMERKKQRLIEALVAAHNKNAEIDKALKQWAGQLAQYAIEIVDAATIQALADAGIKRLMWNTERDERVCRECRELDRQIFRVEEYPNKPHPRCRCYPTLVED